ncbi:MAG: 50S ribosomal protein L23 [Parcubacteria group bacterium GW2011_GWA2_43_17]|nr:MAG: 50S ribosomal protein L23 [Parcubacteria group bacterium GW2011_GWA2_43_17]KKT92743.1 MAG: 50S ribosomal protein L23 [Parcubacteria group bacterium GW2011_GWF2_45_11]KKT97087.1 MAG: 50S ribosomal protein L23 [Parcubacteria group bacterium GW2011_GWC2_45_15]HAH03960.1 50S ribosomal protein L23 [Candidatus Komeilibacteria bacterium]HBR13520.1 50S ribosomal protein L23 [Candidatus Komeilibacteria bacterium]
MGFLNKIIKKSDKSTQKAAQDQTKKVAKPQPERELTIAEIKEKGLTKATAGEAKKSVKASVIKENTREAYRVLLKPLITEKGTYLASHNKYLFAVPTGTNKLEIKKAIKALYGVTPESVNIIAVSGKNVRYGRSKGRTKDRKKAIVTLAKGQSIEVYEGV